MAGVVSLVFFSRIDGERDGKIKREMVRWASLWLLPAFVLLPICFIWYLWMVPSSQRDLMSLGISTIGMGAFTQVTRLTLMSVLTTGTIVGVVYFLAYMSPREFKFGHALAIVVLAFIATASTEGAREMLRKPFIIVDYMFSNGTRKTQVEKFNAEGYLVNSPWKPVAENQLAVGRRMFAGQCMSCHTVEGYRAMTKFLQGRDEKSIGNILDMMHKPSETSPYVKFMPPVVGTDAELAALRAYLYSLVSPPSAAPAVAAQ